MKKTVFHRKSGEAIRIGDTLVRIIGGGTRLVVEHDEQMRCDREEVHLAREKGITPSEARQLIKGER